MAKASCPICGEIPLGGVIVFNDNLRKQMFDISPIFPTCAVCGSNVEIGSVPGGGRIIVLNGTCGSGKSATAEELSKKHGFLAIDGDCVMQVLRHKTGRMRGGFKTGEMVDEVGKEIDILLAFGRDMVLSHVIMPDEMTKYIKLFEDKGLQYRIVLLKPGYETAVERTKTRTCHTSVTPEEWVKFFYDGLTFGDEVEVFDNTGLTVEQAAAEILKEK